MGMQAQGKTEVHPLDHLALDMSHIDWGDDIISTIMRLNDIIMDNYYYT